MLKIKFTFFIILINLAIINLVLPQEFQVYQTFDQDSNKVIWQRGAVSGGAVLASIGIIAFSIDDAYYQDKRVKFRFAKDSEGNLRWFDNRHRAMDKFGHIYTTSLISQNVYFLSRWSGYSNKTSSILASSISIGMLGAMEVWDAHFERWGFSMGDFFANVAG